MFQFLWIPFYIHRSKQFICQRKWPTWHYQGWEKKFSALLEADNNFSFFKIDHKSSQHYYRYKSFQKKSSHNFIYTNSIFHSFLRVAVQILWFNRQCTLCTITIGCETTTTSLWITFVSQKNESTAPYSILKYSKSLV